MSKFNLGGYLKKKYAEIISHYDLKFLTIILKICGSWFPINEYKKVYMIWSIFILSLTLGQSFVVEFVSVVVGWNGTVKITENVSVLLTSYVQFCKLYIFLRHQKRIQRLLDYAEANEFTCDDPRNLKTAAVPIILGYTQFLTLCAIISRLTSIAAAAKNKNRRVLPVHGLYPYDVLTSPFYEITFTLQSVALIHSLLHITSMDNFVIGFMSVIGKKFETLKTNVKEIGDDVRQFGTTEYLRMNLFKQRDVEKRLYKELMLCVEQHLVIIKYITEYEKIFQFAMMNQLFFLCFQLCMLTITVSQEELLNFSTAMTLFGTITAISSQILLYCYFGNVISVQSEGLVNAAYAGNWWRCSERYKRALRLFMAKANQPLILHAGFLLPLSLPTFVVIMRASYSMITLVKGSKNY